MPNYLHQKWLKCRFIDINRTFATQAGVLAITATCLLLSAQQATAQLFPNLGGQRVGIAAMPFLKNDLSPRSVAMGGANVSMSGDIYAPNNNVALATELGAHTVGVSNMGFAGLNHTLATGTFHTKQGTWIATMHNLSAGVQEVRTELRPQGTGAQFASYNAAAGIGYARELSDRFSFGVMVKYMHTAVAEYAAGAVAADVGFLYKTDWRGLRFAATLQHFGTNATFSGNAVREPFNRNGQGAESYPAPTTFKMGASMNLVETEKHRLVGAAELYHPSDNAENVRIGLEYLFIEQFMVRAGYRLNVPNETLPSFGVGFKTLMAQYPIQVDAGIQPSNNLGMVWCAGISFKFAKQETDTSVGNE